MFLQKMESRNRQLHVNQDVDLPDGGYDGPQVEKRWKECLGFEGHDEAPGDATRNINGKEELWNPPPGREIQLDVVKKGLVFDLRAYCSEKKKPSKLYEEEEENLRYQVPSEETSMEEAKVLEEERREIIRKQVVKKRITIAGRWSSVEHLEDLLVRNVTENGSDVCFDSSSSRRALVDPQNVDTEKINFTTARQQFLELEKKNSKLLLRSNKTRDVGHGDGLQGPPSCKDTSFSDAPYHQGRLGGSHERTNLLVWSRKGPSTQVLPGGNQPYSLEKPGWEVKTAVVDGRGSSRRSGEPLDDPDTVEEEEEETPIEREIRLAQEREEDLWKERGIIPKANTREELVQIQTRPLLSVSVSSQKGKEKRPVSFHFQREMEQETRREEALVKEGRLLGTYRKGETQELAQRRRVFEQPEAETTPGKRWEIPKGDDSPASREPSLKSHNGVENQERKWTLEKARLTSLTPEFGQERLGSLPHNMSHPRVMDLPSLTPPSSLGSVLQEEHFAIPVGKLRFSFAGDRETTRGRRNQLASGRGPREEPYTLKTWKPQTSALIDQEIQEALEREEELKEQRRKVQVAPDVSRMSSQSSAASGVAGSYSVSASPVFSPLSPPPWRAFPEQSPHEPDPKSCLSPSRRWREDGKYAGIELSDEIDTEVVQSTKPICRRGVLAQLWESGQIRHIDDDIDDDDNDQA